MIKFNSKITVKILDYFFLNPQKKRYINELADIIEVDVGNLFRKLKELESEGIFSSESQGNQKYYFLNKNYPLLKELKKIFEAKYGLTNILKEKLLQLKNLREAYIFGSYAKDSLQQESDIDVLLIGNHSSIEAQKLIIPIQKTIGREVNVIDITKQDFDERKKRKDEFINNIFSDKVIKLI
jgi:predicted nucleotidyltransferase